MAIGPAGEAIIDARHLRIEIVYLLAPGTEVIGAELVSLWQGGAIDVVAALSLINIVLVFIGLAFALRFGVKLRD